MFKINVLIGVIFLVMLISGCKPIQGLGETTGPASELEDDNSIIEDEQVDEAEEVVIPVDEVLEEARKPVEDPNVKYVRVNTEFLNVREEASISTPKLTKIHLGEIYEVLGETRDEDGLLWYRLEVPGDLIGFVSSDYCDVNKDRTVLEAMNEEETSE